MSCIDVADVAEPHHSAYWVRLAHTVDMERAVQPCKWDPAGEEEDTCCCLAIKVDDRTQLVLEDVQQDTDPQTDHPGPLAVERTGCPEVDIDRILTCVRVQAVVDD